MPSSAKTDRKLRDTVLLGALEERPRPHRLSDHGPSSMVDLHGHGATRLSLTGPVIHPVSIYLRIPVKEETLAETIISVFLIWLLVYALFHINPLIDMLDRIVAMVAT